MVSILPLSPSSFFGWFFPVKNVLNCMIMNCRKTRSFDLCQKVEWCKKLKRFLFALLLRGTSSSLQSPSQPASQTFTCDEMELTDVQIVFIWRTKKVNLFVHKSLRELGIIYYLIHMHARQCITRISMFEKTQFNQKQAMDPFHSVEFDWDQVEQNRGNRWKEN